jgi:WD40 repeat protein
MPPASPRLIRVFVSSTFEDMHAERDYLNRVVWPELRSRCLRRGAELVAIDLRWGVTREDVEARGATAACLAEIERCQYFVGLIGDRYGWVPPVDSVPARVFRQAHANAADATLLDACYESDLSSEPPVYRLRPGRPTGDDEAETLVRVWATHGVEQAGRSITELEVLHALGTLPASRTLFYFRDTAASGAADAFAEGFRDHDPRRRARLDALKASIRGAAVTSRIYRARVEGVRLAPALLPDTLTPAERQILADGVIGPAELALVDGELRRRVDEYGTAALGGLEPWGEQLQEDLWTAIAQDLPAQAPDTASTSNDRASHEQFLVERTALFVGRADLVGQVLAHVHREGGPQPLVVAGEPGSGKSALLAECARQCRQQFPDALVLPHFVGAAPGTTSAAVTVRSICEELKRQRNLTIDLPQDVNELFRAFHTCLEQAAGGGRLILFVDALNQLDETGGGRRCAWLPPSVPAGVTIVVSTIGDDVLERLRQRAPALPVLSVGTMPDEERVSLVQALLAQRGKRLTPGQLARVVDERARPEAGLPLYLTVAVEELSLFGHFDVLDQRIDSLPPSLASLFDQVLVRVEQDHGQPMTERVLRLLAASRAGLLESEVLDLLEDEEPAFSRVRWVRLYRSLQFYLRRFDEISGSGLLDFFHEQIRQAVFRRYFGMPSRQGPPTAAFTREHRRLAGYFAAAARRPEDANAWDATRARPLNELPYHLAHGERRRELRAVLTDFDFMQASVAALGPQPLVDQYDLAVQSPVSLPAPARRGLQLLQTTLRLSAHAIARDSNQLASQLCGRLLGTTSPDAARVLRAAADWRGAAWLRPRNACLVASGGGLERVLIARDAGERVAITPDGARVVASASGRLGVWNVASGQLERTLTDEYDQAFAVAPDGGAIAMAGREGTVEIRDLASGAVVRTVEGQTGTLAAVAFSRDGQLLVTGNGSKDARQRLEVVALAWDLATGALIQRMTGFRGHRIRDIVVSADRSCVIAVGDESRACVWRLDTGELHHELRHQYFVVTSVAATPDGHALTACADGVLTLWDLTTGAAVHRFRCTRRRTTRVAPYAEALAVAADGSRVVMAMMDETLRVWSPVTRAFGRVLMGHADDVLDVAVTADGAAAVSVSRDGTARVWRLDERRKTTVRAGHKGRITSLALTPDGSSVISGSWDHTIKAWELTTGDERATLTGHAESVNAVLVTPDGRRVVSSASDRTVRVWSLRRGAEERSFPGGSTRGEWPTERLVVLTPDGTHIVNAAMSGVVAMQRVQSKAVVWTHVGDWLPDYVAVTPDGRRVLLCSDLPYVLVLDATTGKRVLRLQARDALPEIVVATPDSEMAVVGYQNGTVRAWNLKGGTIARTFRGHGEVVSALGVTATGRFAVSGDRAGGLKVWDLVEGRAHATLASDVGRIWMLSMAPAGRHCATASDDHALRVWDIEAGRQVAALLTDGTVWACAFTSDGRTVVSGGDSGRVHIVDLVEPASRHSTRDHGASGQT